LEIGGGEANLLPIRKIISEENMNEGSVCTRKAKRESFPLKKKVRRNKKRLKDEKP